MDCYSSLCIPQIVTLRFTTGANVKYQQVDKGASITLSSRNAVTDFIPQENNLEEHKQSDLDSRNFIDRYPAHIGSLDFKYKATIEEAELVFTQIKVAIKNHAERLEKVISQNWSTLSGEILENYRKIRKTIEGNGEFLNNPVKVPFQVLDINNIQTTILKKEQILWLEEELRKGGWVLGERLFAATSEDRNCASCFHSKCDEKGATLTVVKIPGLMVFGGFTSTSWSCYQGYVYSANTWLFKLEQDNFERIEINPGCQIYSVYHHPDRGPSFGHGHDICIHVGRGPNRFSYCEKKAFSSGIFTGRLTFKTMEYEVFQVVGLSKVIV